MFTVPVTASVAQFLQLQEIYNRAIEASETRRVERSAEAQQEQRRRSEFVAEIRAGELRAALLRKEGQGIIVDVLA